MDDQIEGFTLNCQGHRLDISFYLKSITTALSKTINRIYLARFWMDANQFNTVVKASSQCKELIFSLLSLKLNSDLDFSIETSYKLELIDFKNSGLSDRSDWISNSGNFDSIIKAISKSGLKNSLKKIGIKACEIELDYAMDVLNKNGINHVAVTLDEADPFPI